MHELQETAVTISTLRKMRGAATMKAEYAPKGRQEILSDAERLAHSASRYLVGSATGRPAPGSYEEWSSTLRALNKSYQPYDDVTTGAFGRMPLTETAGYFLMHLKVIKNSYLEWYLFEFNNTGSRDLGALSRRNIGIFSPLSSDYLLAYIFKEYQSLSKKDLHVKPVAVGRNGDVVLPVSPDGRGVFCDKDEIAIFLEGVTTGNTGKAMLRAIREAYQSKRIHEPDFDKMAKSTGPT